MNIDHGKVLGRGLKDVAVVMDLLELVPVGGRATSGRDGRRFERFAQVGEDRRTAEDATGLPDRCRRPCGPDAGLGAALRRGLMAGGVPGTPQFPRFVRQRMIKVW